MRKTLLALTAATGIMGFGAIGASAYTLGPMKGSGQVTTAEGSMIQKADWYCGPHCQYSRHRRWEESRRWRDYHHGYSRYGYNGGYGPYYR
jgi:hypothetical protein